MNIAKNASPIRAAAHKAMIGGGCITTPAVAAHVRKQTPQVIARTPQNPSTQRSAVIGGGCITTPAVAAHARRKMANDQR